MATLNVRLDDKLKSEVDVVLKGLNTTASEVIRQTLQYIVDNGHLPIKTLTVSDSEAQLIATVRERLKNPQLGIKVSLDDL
ncbi:MAG: type II toxin-antitoxin system RelB/DinJ family antitoxin [Thiotrichaceae bacterium]|nr:type II toxin-antitoxin system RelB/DinJ family antitoxin [Thiotrichaceae bacterium]